MKLRLLVLPFALWLACFPAMAAERPPYRGTIFEFPKLMTDSDTSAFTKISYSKKAQRSMFDRRLDRFAKVDVFLFQAQFNDHAAIEVAVNCELDSEERARQEAEYYVVAFGRLPVLLRDNIDALHIQGGKQLFGGGRNLLIHIEQGKEYAREGILEEALAHEAAHALDKDHAKHPDWISAQKKDPNFISTYALENPAREDLAESIVPYFAVRYRTDRITAKQRAIILSTIPARMSYFDTLKSTGFPEAKSKSR